MGTNTSICKQPWKAAILLYTLYNLLKPANHTTPHHERLLWVVLISLVSETIVGGFVVLLATKPRWCGFVGGGLALALGNVDAGSFAVINTTYKIHGSHTQYRTR